MHNDFFVVCSFRHESSVFEPELFDIYLSYCQKSSSVTTKSKSLSGSSGSSVGTTTATGAGAAAAIQSSFGISTLPSSNYVSVTDLASTWLPEVAMPLPQSPPTTGQYYFAPPNTSVVPATTTTVKPLLASYPKKVLVGGAGGVASGGGGGGGVTHVVADRGSHTIYDSELKLLLDPRRTQTQSKRFVEEFTTYKHGSFLLYSQRGLLETLPLIYTCLSVTGNATVLEPSIHSASPQVGSALGHHQQSSHHQGMTKSTSAGTTTTTTGYCYPSGVLETGKQRRDHASSSSSPSLPSKPSAPSSTTSSSRPIPQILMDIGIAPKELVMQVECLKSGVAYSALLKFPQPVALTDLSIPATGSMSSVSVDVWLEPEEEERGECVRVAQSSEIKTRSLMMGNLTPPPVCQYVKVWCIWGWGGGGAIQTLIGIWESAHCFSA